MFLHTLLAKANHDDMPLVDVIACDEGNTHDLSDDKSHGDDSPPVDMEHLAMFTDGDPDEEKELLDLFFEQTALCLQELVVSYEQDDADEWRKMAHKIKGSAANLGAHRLSEHCKLAEQHYQQTKEEKKAMLDAIKQGIIELETFFQRSTSIV